MTPNAYVCIVDSGSQQQLTRRVPSVWTRDVVILREPLSYLHDGDAPASVSGAVFDFANDALLFSGVPSTVRSGDTFSVRVI